MANLSLSNKRVVRLTPALDMPADIFERMFDRIDEFSEHVSTSGHLLTCIPPTRVAKIAAFAANRPRHPHPAPDQNVADDQTAPDGPIISTRLGRRSSGSGTSHAPLA